MRVIRVIAVGLALLIGAPSTEYAQVALGAPWDRVAEILQAPGGASGGTYRYAFPRSDLRVRIGDVTLDPAIALGSWAGFGSMGPDTVVMGDLVVTGEELGPVLRQLAAESISVWAIHNHLVGEAPRVLYLHYEARGSALDLAAKLSRVIARTGVPRPVRPSQPSPVSVDTALVFQELGSRGRANGAVVQLSFDLVGTAVTIGGQALPLAIAYGSPVNIQKVSAERAVAAGDFAVQAEKVDPVLDALTGHGIVATAVHSHLIGETPTLYYIHFWADGPLPGVVRGLRAALDAARRSATPP